MSSSSKPNSRKRKAATVYDAVAGRVGYEGFILSQPKPSRYRDLATNSQAPVGPEEVLFRRKNAAPRYEEDDVYDATRHLDPSNPLQRLPDSDLLKVLHAYASDFYAAATEDGGECDWRSLDETALLALGILIEEAAREVLGETGDLAFVEADGISDGGSGSQHQQIARGRSRGQVKMEEK